MIPRQDISNPASAMAGRIWKVNGTWSFEHGLGVVARQIHFQYPNARALALLPCCGLDSAAPLFGMQMRPTLVLLLTILAVTSKLVAEETREIDHPEIGAEFEPWRSLHTFGPSMQIANNGARIVKFAVPVLVPNALSREISIVAAAKTHLIRKVETQSAFQTAQEAASAFSKWSSSLSKSYGPFEQVEANSSIPHLNEFRRGNKSIHISTAQQPGVPDVKITYEDMAPGADGVKEDEERSIVNVDNKGVYSGDIVIQTGELKNTSVNPPVAQEVQLHVVLTWTWNTEFFAASKRLNTIFHSACTIKDAYITMPHIDGVRASYGGLNYWLSGDAYLADKQHPLPGGAVHGTVNTLFNPGSGSSKGLANNFNIAIKGDRTTDYTITISFDGSAKLDEGHQLEGKIAGETEIDFYRPEHKLGP
jgi:hypothetical protein